MTTPFTHRTTVLIPHYNNLEGLKTSLSAVWHKKGINVVVVDDGSNYDQLPAEEDLKSFVNAKVDLEVIYLGSNQGIAVALNTGMDYIIKHDNSEFIARLDCGDTCVQNRFMIQEDYFDQNPSYDLIGSWVKFKDKDREVFNVKPPKDHESIKKKMAVRCNFIHPSVMFRTKVIREQGYYPTDVEAAEDYAYFYRIINERKTANIPKFLTTVDYNHEGISRLKRVRQNKSKIKVIMSNGSMGWYKVYGVAFNVALLVAPRQFVYTTKKIIKGA